MNTNYGTIGSMVGYTDKDFKDIDKAVCDQLCNASNDYAKMYHHSIKLLIEFPIISRLMEDENEKQNIVNLLVDEQIALTDYLRTKHKMEVMERKHLYYCGYIDNYAHMMKMIGIHVD